ncbi:hypothetical protein AHMF7605_25725 [Adhaeribacter arboris]|uniref:H repeat-associated protein N-terminal domain-containing protein n=1 Tax=Adhaeribacter arboris TaxID=2072846 RepID=A0A2T2YMB6_9BACT|nr:transposase family protein [Adhaeribacter arboris]PSR56651.1 hypothetical protein AHMF7605_25725 [Adhaeribacter arboris]
MNKDIKNIFSNLVDYRRECALKLPLLEDIIATYGEQKKEFLSTFLFLPHGIPSHDTITQVFRYLYMDQFSVCLYCHSSQLLDF